MDAPEPEGLYRRWLSEGLGVDTDMARDMMAEDIMTKTPIPASRRARRAQLGSRHDPAGVSRPAVHPRHRGVRGQL